MAIREVIFRGKRIDNGEWVYGDLRQYSEKSKGIFDYATKHTIQVTPETIGQYTGLTDKNGTKIFEGDIVRVCLPNGCQFIEKVRFANGGFLPYIIDYSDSFFWGGENTEVIGNIHDNPELLKELGK